MASELPGRTLADLEAPLSGEVVDEVAIGLAHQLLEQRALAPRVAALLSEAYARLGGTNEEIGMLTRELRLARGPRLGEVQRRLAALRQDVLGDVAGATELLDQVMIRDPSDDESRRRFVANSIAMSRSKEAAQLLSRVLRSAPGHTQAKVALDIGVLYSNGGDNERARRAFAQVVDSDADAASRLAAARHLLEMRSGLAPQVLVRPLAALAECESDAGARMAAASELLDLRGRAKLDANCEIVAWRALLDGPRADEALTALEALYDRSANRLGLCEVLERRAAREPDAAAAQALALRSAEMYGGSAVDPAMALAAWQRYVARFGPARQAHARMIPLLERAKNFEELAKVLAAEIELTPEPQRATSLGRLGEVRFRHLSDTGGALELFRRGLELSPRESRSRACLEEVLADPAWASVSADVLEPLYRSELASSERSRRMLRRVLALRAERARETEDRLRACTELGEMLEAEGNGADALTWYERAWSLDPKRTELLARVDCLAEREGQSPEDRLERYIAAVDRVERPEERAELLCAIGMLEHSRGDVPAAVSTWRRALEVQPAHFAIHEALLRAYGELGDFGAAMEELRRALPYFEGHKRQVTVVRIADALAARGAHRDALDLCRPLLYESTLDETVLPALEKIAEAAEDAETAQLVFERAVSAAKDVDTRAHALERLGEFLEGWPGNLSGAARCWKAAAAEYLTLPGGAGQALRLLERALDHTPEDIEPARRLFELYLETGEWLRTPEVYALLLRAENPAPAIELLLSHESSAVLAGAASEFSELVEHALWRLYEMTSPWKHPLIAARARVFASAGRREEAAEVYRMLLELYADDGDARDLQALIDSSPPGAFRLDNQRWLFAWRADAAKDSVERLVEWATAEETLLCDQKAAIAVWERAALRDPSRVDIWQALVRLKIDAGDVEAGLDAVQPLRALLSDEARLELELQLATTLIDRLDRADRALPILGSVLEKAPTDAAARALVFRIVRSPYPLRAGAGEILEQASAASDTPEERKALFEQLLEATNVESSDTAQLPVVRRRWFDRLFELTGGEASFAVAERAALEFPGDDAIWRRLELSSCQLENPHKAVEVYLLALGRPISGEVAELLGRRLTAFADERAESPRIVTTALERVLELSPGARWAVDRVKLALTAEQRWPTLFALYERAADAAADDVDRADLLDEAAIAARDVAGDLDRAIEYWERVFHLRPGDTRVDLTLERLYEKQSHTKKLIAHLLRRGESYSGARAKALRERVASLWLDLSEGAAALEIIESVLSDHPHDETAHRLLERVFALGSLKAGSLLRQHYAKARHSTDLARVLEGELALVTAASDRIERLESLYDIRHELGDRTKALECLGELVALEPTILGHREKLAKLAGELGTNARLAELLIAAADRAADQRVSADLLRQAAAVRAERLSDIEGAADLYARILSGPYEHSVRADAARTLSSSLEKIVQPGRRCDVLEWLASFENEPEARRNANLGAAAVALDELGDPVRALRILRSLGDRLANDPEVRNALVRALRAADEHIELADALTARAADSEGAEARRDLVELARICVERLSDLERAIDVWSDVRRRFEPDTESFEALARLFEVRGQWQELASLLSEETKASPSGADLFERLGDVHRDHTLDTRAAIDAYIAAGNPEKARLALESDERLLSKDPALCVTVARAAEGAGAFDRAESLLRRHLEQAGVRRPKEHAQVHLELAGVLSAKGRGSEAFELLSTAAELYPTDPDVLAALGRTAFERGDLERAERTYRSLLLLLRHSSDGHRAGSSRSEVYVELAELASLRDEGERARDLMASALEAALESDDERAGLERALRRRSKFDELETALQAQFARADHPGAAARALAALVAFRRERQSLDEISVAQMIERADRLRRDLGLAPSDASELGAFRELTHVYVALEQPESAVELLDVMSAHAGSSAEGVDLAFEAARLLVQVPFRQDEAATRLQAIWKSNPSRADVAILLSRVLEEDGRIEEALDVCRALPLERGRERETLEAIVRLEQARGGDQAGLAGTLERLLEFEQGTSRADVARRLAALRKEQGDVEGIERALAVGVAADPTNADLRDELVALYLGRGAFADAAFTLERALASSTDAALRWRLSEIYQKAGDISAALRAIDFVPTSRTEKAQLGRRRFQLLEAAGRTEDALVELEAAYHIDTRCGPELLAAVQRTPLATSTERWVLLAADLLARYGDPAKGRRALAAWLETNPTSRPALRRLAKIAAKERDFPTAIDSYRKLSRAETGEARKSAVLELAKVCEAAGRRADALPDLEAALADAPKDIQFSEAVRKLRALGAGEQTVGPEAAKAVLLQARKHLASDELVEAFDALSHAHRIDKSDTEVAYLLGLVALDLDQIDVASAALRAFVATRDQVVSSTRADEPTRVSRAYFHLAIIERNRGDDGAARRMVWRAMEESPNNGDAQRLMEELWPSSMGN